MFLHPPPPTTTGFDTENIPVKVWVGGETEALQRLNRHLERKAWVANFERPRMSPIALNPSPTSLSPYLRFGCLSSRMFYWELTDLFIKVSFSRHLTIRLSSGLSGDNNVHLPAFVLQSIYRLFFPLIFSWTT